MLKGYSYDYYKVSADYIRERIGFVPEMGIILGTGCGPFADKIENPISFSYREIPNFLVATNPDHAGMMIAGTVAGKKVICMKGRFHHYEGYSMEELSIPVHVLKILGIQKLILTNAAGGVNTSFKPGDAMVITDHIKLNCASPMCGPNVPELGTRFFDASDIYSRALREKAKACIERSPMTVHEGVYMFFTGPQFETPAEIRAARILGADAVGMSTVTEALCAAHCKLPVFGVCLITNMAAGIISGEKLDGSEVEECAKVASKNFSALLFDIVKTI